MADVTFARRVDADLAQEPLSGPIQQPDERVGQSVEPYQGRSGPQSRRQGFADGERLGSELTDDDQQERVHEEAESDGDRVAGAFRDQAGPLEERLEGRSEHGLDQYAQTQADQGDAQLRGADGRVEVLDEFARQGGAAIPLTDERVEVRM